MQQKREPRRTSAAVEFDRLDLGCRRIAAQSNHVDVVKQVGHVHEAVIQGSGKRVGSAGSDPGASTVLR